MAPVSAWWRASPHAISPTLVNEFVASYVESHITLQGHQRAGREPAGHRA